MNTAIRDQIADVLHDELADCPEPDGLPECFRLADRIVADVDWSEADR